MLRPVFRAFFYARPVLLTPAGNRLFVPLTSAPFGLLATPIHRPQDVPDGAGVVLHPERHGDHLGHPRQGPQLCTIPMFARTSQQQPDQPPALPDRQPAGSARMRLRLQGILASGLNRLPPPRHRGPRCAHRSGNSGWLRAPVEQGHGTSSTSFQLLCRSLRSHGSPFPSAERIIGKAIAVTLTIQRSIGRPPPSPLLGTHARAYQSLNTPRRRSTHRMRPMPGVCMGAPPVRNLTCLATVGGRPPPLSGGLQPSVPAYFLRNLRATRPAAPKPSSDSVAGSGRPPCPKSISIVGPSWENT